VSEALANSAIKELSSEERQAASELKTTLPQNFSWSQLSKAALEAGAAYRESRRSTWTKRREGLGAIHPVQIAAASDPERFRKIIAACAAAGVSAGEKRPPLRSPGQWPR
jgi:hypothetical protein